MTALPLRTARPWARVVALPAGGLAAAVIVRVALQGSSSLSGFGAGLAFGAALLVIARACGWRARWPGVLPLLLGAAGGLVLIVLPRLMHPGVPVVLGMRPEPFVVWLGVTALVATAEEVLLRGVLFDAVSGVWGPIAAVAVSSVLFGLIHVPLYGWSVVPLDIGVGVWLAGLRLASGSVGAPAVAHTMADVATWWR